MYVEVNRHTGERHLLHKDELVHRLSKLGLPAVTVTGYVNSLERDVAPKIDLDHQWFRKMEGRDTYMATRPEWTVGMTKGTKGKR